MSSSKKQTSLGEDNENIQFKGKRQKRVLESSQEEDDDLDSESDYESQSSGSDIPSKSNIKPDRKREDKLRKKELSYNERLNTMAQGNLSNLRVEENSSSNISQPRKRGRPKKRTQLNHTVV